MLPEVILPCPWFGSAVQPYLDSLFANQIEVGSHVNLPGRGTVILRAFNLEPPPDSNSEGLSRIKSALILVHREYWRCMSEESDRMMVLLQELAGLKKTTTKGTKARTNNKRRRQIGQEMKKLAAEKKSAQG